MTDSIALRGDVSPSLAAGLVGLAALAAIGTALAFEHIGGYEPCPLCLQQRWAYYAAIPIGFLSVLLFRNGQTGLARAALIVLGLAFVANAGLGVFHSGVEWQWWPGPASCSGGTISLEAGKLLEAVQSERVVRCDEAPWRLFGLSFAGYSALISAGLACIAAWGVLRAKSA